MKIPLSSVIRSALSFAMFVWLFRLVGYVLANFIYPRMVMNIPRSTKLHPTVLMRQPKNITIGSQGLINHGCVIQAGYETAKVCIGDYVHCGPYVQFFAYNHKYNDLELPSILQGYVEADITICDDVWIGAGSVIVAGAFVAKGSVIGANSVVIGRLETEYGIYAGAPARLIKQRG